jgi:hypothetical protein
MNDPKQIVEWVNRIRWCQHDVLSLEAERLVALHTDRIRPVVRHLMTATESAPAEAHGLALTPAHDTEEYGRLIDALFEDADLSGAGVREPLIMTIAANAVWRLDPDLATFANPWEPLVKLYSLGYPASYVDTPDHQHVQLRVGLRNGTCDFPTI